MAKAAVEKYPFIGNCAKVIGGIFADRGGSEEARQKIVNDIITAQHAYEKGERKSKILIFPEGGTSNNSCILDFKRGAFEAGVAVLPCLIYY